MQTSWQSEAMRCSGMKYVLNTDIACVPGGIGRAATRTTNNRSVFWEEKTAENLLATCIKHPDHMSQHTTKKRGQSLFLWDWIKLSQSIENQEHLSV